MEVIKKKRAPFGSNVKRFSGIGYHPVMECRPGTYRYPNLHPGCYDFNKPSRIVTKVPSWNRCLKVEEFSRRLAYRGDHILKRRLWDKTINGPGWHDIPTVSSVRNITFSRKERFPISKAKGFAVSGPGTYGKYHVPHTKIEEKSHAKGFSFSILAPFEGVARRPKSLHPQPLYHLPPNIYNIKTSIEELLSKRVSKRGPYDLFTGPRYQRTVTPEQLDRKQIPPLRIDFGQWNHPKNAFKGKFLRSGKDTMVTSRIILKDSTANTNKLAFPGPSEYEPYPPPVVTRCLFPFNSSVSEARISLKKDLLPPPGRYNPDRKSKRIKGDGLRSAFISKTTRNVRNVPKCSWFE